MNKNKISLTLALVSTISICSCASTNAYDLTTSFKREFFDSTKSFSGIEAVRLDNSKLTISLIDKTLFEQYEVPLKHGKPDLAKKTKTGKSEWGYVKTTHKIIILGFDKDYEFIVEPNNNEAQIDLQPAILNSHLPKNTNLTIRCADCDLLSIKEQNIFPNVKTDVVLKHDFKATKLALSEAQKNRDAEAEKVKTEQIKRDKEIAKQAQTQKTSAILIPVVSTTSEESSIGNLEEIKAKCKGLGFKLQSEKFGKCVLELTK